MEIALRQKGDGVAAIDMQQATAINCIKRRKKIIWGAMII